MMHCRGVNCGQQEKGRRKDSYRLRPGATEEYWREKITNEDVLRRAQEDRNFPGNLKC